MKSRFTRYMEKCNIHVLVVVGILGFICIVYIQWQNTHLDNQNTNQFCNTYQEIKTVRGNSMEPFFYPGEDIMVQMGYYKCNSIQRDEVVLINYVGNDVPIIKFVKGIPGDILQTKKNDKNLKWNVYINNKVLKNAENIPYSLSDNDVREIGNYEKAYGGKIPYGKYLIFGNIPKGSIDSTKFGLMGKESIIAKVDKIDQM